MNERPTQKPLLETSPEWQQARMLGRREALDIILEQNAEDFPDEFQQSRPLADTGDYITYWNEDKLTELLDAKNPSSLIEHLDASFWKHAYEIGELKCERDEARAELADIRQRLKGHPDSRLDGENGLAAATMRGFEGFQAENEAMRAALSKYDEWHKLVSESHHDTTEEFNRRVAVLNEARQMAKSLLTP